MKNLISTAIVIFLTTFLMAAANNGPAGTAGNPQPQQGKTSGEKAMDDYREREKARREVKKKAFEKRQQAMRDAAAGNGEQQAK